MQVDLSIVIVNYNVKYFLEQCLFSVRKAVSPLRAEIFVVDNHSTDGSRAYLESRFPEVSFLWNSKNVGFAKACNAAAVMATGEVILFLNPDTILPEDSLIKCLAFIREQKDCGAVGVKMLDGKGKFLKESKRGFPTPAASFFRLSGLTYLLPRSGIFSAYYAGHLPENENNEVDVIAGAFLMVPREVLDKSGLFDEDFFMYGEDIDLSYRIQKAGFKNYYFSETSIIHFKGESTMRSRKYIRHFYQAMHLFIRKHTKSSLKRIMSFMAVSIGKWIALLRLAFYGNYMIRKKQAPDKVAVICTQAEFTGMVHLVKHASTPVVIHGRVGVSPDDLDNAIGTIDDAPVLAGKGKKHFILTEGYLTFKEMIAIVERWCDICFFSFHAKGSDSIVGSEDKNSRGYFIARK